MSDNTSQEPGLMSSHLQYAKGVAEATVGGITGSHAWKSSGEQDKAAGLSNMRAAGDKRDPTHGYGRPEELAGKLVGCDGMKKEGAESIKKD